MCRPELDRPGERSRGRGRGRRPFWARAVTLRRRAARRAEASAVHAWLISDIPYGDGAQLITHQHAVRWPGSRADRRLVRKRYGASQSVRAKTHIKFCTPREPWFHAAANGAYGRRPVWCSRDRSSRSTSCGQPPIYSHTSERLSMRTSSGGGSACSAAEWLIVTCARGRGRSLRLIGAAGNLSPPDVSVRPGVGGQPAYAEGWAGSEGR
jgi:hypothetical protein